jgi:hypothetical protein
MSTPRIDLRRGVVEPVVLMISRREVEASDVLPAVSRLHTLLSTSEAIWHYRGQITLVVDGYSDDSRELVDIAEVRDFLRALDQRWPYWAFFFNQVDDSIKLFVSCLCGFFYPGGGLVEIDRERLGQFLTRGFAAMRSLFNDHGFPEDEMEAMSNGVIELVEQAGMA